MYADEATRDAHIISAIMATDAILTSDLNNEPNRSQHFNSSSYLDKTLMDPEYISGNN